MELHDFVYCYSNKLTIYKSKTLLVGLSQSKCNLQLVETKFIPAMTWRQPVLIIYSLDYIFISQ
jgi:hypothetical protein